MRKINFRQENRKIKFLSVLYHRFTTNFRNMWEDHDIKFMFKLNHTIHDLVEKVDDFFQKNEIYEVNDNKYLGQTGSFIKTLMMTI